MRIKTMNKYIEQGLFEYAETSTLRSNLTRFKRHYRELKAIYKSKYFGASSGPETKAD